MQAMNKPEKRTNLVILPPTAWQRNGALTQSAAKAGSQRAELPAYRSRLLIHILSALVMAGGVWCGFTKLDVIARGPATVIPYGDVKVIQPVFDGVVEKVFVQEGDHVQVGQKLVFLDRTVLAAKVNKQARELDIAKSELRRLQLAQTALKQIIARPDSLPDVHAQVGKVSELVGQVYTAAGAEHEASIDCASSGNSDDAAISDRATLEQQLHHMQNEKIAKQRSMFEREKQFKAEEIELRQKLLANKNLLSAAETELVESVAMVEKAEEQEKAFKYLEDQGAVSRFDYLNNSMAAGTRRLNLLKHRALIADLRHQVSIADAALKRFSAQFQAEIAGEQAAIGQLSADMLQIQLKLRHNERDFKLAGYHLSETMLKAQDEQASLVSALAEKEQRIGQLESALAEVQHLFDQAAIVSPVAGTVTGLKVWGRQEVVRTGQSLMTIIPANSRLVVEAQIPNGEIGFVARGQDAKLRFAAFPFQEFGIVGGKVLEVEAHATTNGKESFYRVRIAPENNWILARGQKRPFVSGMEVTAEIVTRKRSILETLLDSVNTLKDANNIRD